MVDANFKKLYNRHDGEKCSILLHGPSLLRYDLADRDDRVWITVNNFHRIPEIFDERKPDYWIGVYSWDDKHHNMKDPMRICKDNNISVIGTTPKSEAWAQMRQFFDEYDEFFTWDWHSREFQKDFSEKKGTGVYSRGCNISIHSLAFAIYMGFTDIEILGLDLKYSGNNTHAGYDVKNHKENKERSGQYVSEGLKRSVKKDWEIITSNIKEEKIYNRSYDINNICVENIICENNLDLEF